MTRLDVLKTYKLFIGGTFPRAESGRSWPIAGPGGETAAHLCKASRKDLRDAVEAARRAQPGWSNATGYNRGQVLYRMAEMMEGKAGEFAAAIDALAKPAKKRAGGGKRSSANSSSFRSSGGRAEVAAAVDRLVCFAGWADKYSQVLGCNNPVAGPYYNFTVPEPTGVVAVVPPDEPSLLGLISLLAPPLCAGNAVVSLSSGTNPIPAAILGEVCATSDVPGGVVNILTGERDELLSHVATHRDIDAIHAAGLSPAGASLVESGIAENIKRITVRRDTDWFDDDTCHSPWWIEPFVEMKTIWHPASV